MTTKAQNYLEDQVVWRESADPVYPYQAEIDGEKLVIRINDFPDENLYTLIVNNAEVASFDDWPDLWVRPSR